MSNAIDGLNPPDCGSTSPNCRRSRDLRNTRRLPPRSCRYRQEAGLGWAQDLPAQWWCGKPASKASRVARWSACRGTSTWSRKKRPDKKHDFLKDPITLVRKGNAMMADGTTLARQRRGGGHEPGDHGGRVARPRAARVPLHDRRGDGPDPAPTTATRVPQEQERCSTWTPKKKAPCMSAARRARHDGPLGAGH